MKVNLIVEEAGFDSAAVRILYVATCLGGEALSIVREDVDLIADNRDDTSKWPEGWHDYEDLFKALDAVYLKGAGGPDSRPALLAKRDCPRRESAALLEPEMEPELELPSNFELL